MAQPPRRQPTSAFQTAIEDLTDGVSQLIRNHVDLARTELRQELTELRTDALALALSTAVALIGYAILNIAIITLALWLGGVGPMAIAAVVMTVLNFVLAALGFRFAYRRLNERQGRLDETQQELKRNKQWMKELRDNSPKRLTTEAAENP